MEYYCQHVHHRTLPDVWDRHLSRRSSQRTTRLAIGSFCILLCGQFVNSALGHQGKSLEAFGNVRLLLANGTTFLGVTLFLDLLLIPRYGIYGAAIGSSSGLVVAKSARLRGSANPLSPESHGHGVLPDYDDPLDYHYCLGSHEVAYWIQLVLAW